MNTTDPRLNSTGSPPSPAAQCSVNLHFRVRLCCDYGHGEKWGEWHELAMPRAKYGQLLDKILADPEVKDFEVQHSPNAEISQAAGGKE